MNALLTGDQRALLDWIAVSGSGQYGECYGKTLDDLMNRGYVALMGDETEMLNSFIAKGRGIMYRAVCLTDAGRAALIGDAS